MITKEERIIKKIKSIHDDKYSFIKFNYTSYKDKVTLICSEHGEFNISLSNLIGNKRGCPQCGIINSKKSCISNKEEFILKANKIHNFKYNYEFVEYNNWKTKVIIVCSIHGRFNQSPNIHLRGSSCSKCNKGRPRIEKNKLSKNEVLIEKSKKFIEVSNKIHENKYDYSRVEYLSSNKKVNIFCKKHGEFEQTPTHHKRGNGCPSCAYENSFGPRIETSQFILISRNKHKGYYTYEHSVYISNKEKVTITCPLHGDFNQLPKYHMNGGGCPKCNIGRHGKGIGNKKLKYKTDEIIDMCLSIFNGKYDYSKVVYKGMKSKIKIICPYHGEFDKKVESHINGIGCSECSLDQKKRSKEDLIVELNNIHKLKYNYLIDNDFISTTDKIKIVCKEHGLFSQTLETHIRGSGCNLCKTRSRGEISIKYFLEKNEINYIREKSFEGRLRFDFWLPNLKTIIEFDGRHHFQPIKHFGGDIAFEKVKNNDMIKNNYCKKNSINLIRISYKDLKNIEKILKKELIENVKLQT